jgi:hypothetical protein
MSFFGYLSAKMASFYLMATPAVKAKHAKKKQQKHCVAL